MRLRERDSAVSIALLYPELLGTYGDGGNAVVLAQRLHWRGIAADVVEVGAGEHVPESCDIYLMGGGEDGPQALAADELSESGALHRAVERGRGPSSPSAPAFRCSATSSQCPTARRTRASASSTSAPCAGPDDEWSESCSWSQPSTASPCSRDTRTTRP